MKLSANLNSVTFSFLTVMAVVVAFGSEWKLSLCICVGMLLLAVIKFMVRACQQVRYTGITWVVTPFVLVLTLSLGWMFLYDFTYGGWVELICLAVMMAFLICELWKLFIGNPKQVLQIGAILVISVVILVANLGVERQHNERMKYRMIEMRDYQAVELTTSRGDKVTANSPELVARLRGRTDETIQVSMTGWYDLGRLRGYQIHSVDGVSQ